MTVPSSITIEDAVALLINFPRISSKECDLLGYLTHLAEEAEYKYEESIGNLAKYNIHERELKFNLHAARLTMAQSLFEQIELDLAEDYILKKSQDSSHELTLESLIEWAQQEIYIVINPELIVINSELKTFEIESKPKKEYKGLSPTKTKNFYLTFVCLLKAFVSKSGKKFGTVNDLNHTSLAKHLASFTGQSDESIIDRIEEAIKDVEASKK
jgi:hypothetical protein